MGGAIADGGGVGRLPRGFDRIERHAHLRIAASQVGQLLDGLPLPIAAEEIHARVDAGRIAPQRLLDEADGLDVGRIVHRAAQAQARNHVGDRCLAGSLLLVLFANDFFRGDATRRKVVVDHRTQRRAAKLVFAGTMQQLDDARGVDVGWERVEPRCRAAFEIRQQIVGGAHRRARREHFIRQPAEILDERELQHARPRPHLPDGQRSDALVAFEKQRQLRDVEAAVAMADQLDGDRIDARLARALAQGQRRKLAVVPAGKVLADVENVRGNEVKVVEQPFRRGRDEQTVVHVGRERAVGRSQRGGVLLEPREDASRPCAAARIDREARREGQCALLEPLDPEQLVAERLYRQRGVPVIRASRTAAAGDSR